jgi:hypothetical protein
VFLKRSNGTSIGINSQGQLVGPIRCLCRFAGSFGGKGERFPAAWAGLNLARLSRGIALGLLLARAVLFFIMPC